MYYVLVLRNTRNTKPTRKHFVLCRCWLERYKFRWMKWFVDWGVPSATVRPRLGSRDEPTTTVAVSVGGATTGQSWHSGGRAEGAGGAPGLCFSTTTGDDSQQKAWLHHVMAGAGHLILMEIRNIYFALYLELAEYFRTDRTIILENFL